MAQCQGAQEVGSFQIACFILCHRECQGTRVWCLRMDSTLFTQANGLDPQISCIQVAIQRELETDCSKPRNLVSPGLLGPDTRLPTPEQELKLFTKWYREDTPVPCTQTSKIALNH